MIGSLASAVALNLVARDWLPASAAWVALVPFFMALVKSQNRLRCVLLTLTVNLGLVVPAFEGVLPVLPWTFPLAIVLSMPLWTLGSLLLSNVPPSARPAHLWLLPIGWTAIEFVSSRRWLWGSLASPVAIGYTQDWAPLLTLASVAGVQGVGFIVVLLNVAVTHCMVTRRGLPLLVTVTAVAALLLAGGISQKQGDDRGRVAVGIAQPAIAPDWYSAAETSLEASRHVLGELAQISSRLEVDLVVWPEGALPATALVPFALPQLRSAIGNERELLTGAVSRRGTSVYNSVLHLDLLSGESEVVFDKLALVPVGESGFQQGDRYTVGYWGNTLIAPLICLDSAYGVFARRLASMGAELLVVLSDDSFSRAMATSKLHLRTAVFRAVETGLPVVFASAAGPSAVVSPSGRILAQSEIGKRSAVAVEVPLTAGSTAYVRLGDWLGAACTALLMTVLLSAFCRRNRLLSLLLIPIPRPA